MNKRVAFIVPYFGQLPNYFQIFLNSCSYNSEFEWIIFSDDMTRYDYPTNVHFVKMSFDECKDLVQSKFDFDITLHIPQKLCDYKCAYGYIFSDYISNYDWWGHCDLDQIFGNLAHFVTEDMLNRYDKIGSLGHLTLYRNTPQNNIVFKDTCRYREVFTTKSGCGFDEWLPGNINEIYLNNKRNVNLDNFGADVNPYKTVFEIVYFDLNSQTYVTDDVHNSIFEAREGHIYQLYNSKNGLEKREFPYVHFQKRRMKDLRLKKEDKDYYIVPNSFRNNNESPRKLLIRAAIWYLFNFQFFKVKMNSLKYRIKTSDWKFTNVFKDNVKKGNN